MFVELQKEQAEKLEEYLKGQGIEHKSVEIPLTRPVPVMRIEFENLSEQQKKEILDVVTQIKGYHAPTRHRPWDDKMHTPKEEFKGWWTGEAAEEEVRYERDEV